MVTGAEAENLDITSDQAPKPDDIAAALEEARQNARLLRVSSSLFLREAKELIDADKASVLVWASDFLEGSTDDAQERLQELQQSTTSCGVPSVSVESKKRLAELVGLGKIGGRLRRQAICLLAVVLDPVGEEAPALNKLLEQLPKGSLQRKKSVPVPLPITPSAKAAPSKATVFRHHYTPDAPRFKAAFAQKDSLPVLRRTGSLASSRRSSDAGQVGRPDSAQHDKGPTPIPEGSQLEAMPSASKAPPEPSTPEPAAAPAGAAPRTPASVAAAGKVDKPLGAELAAEPAKGAAVQDPQSSDGLHALEAVKTFPGDSSSSPAAQTSATSRKDANGQATPKKNPAKPVEAASRAMPPITVSSVGGEGGSKKQPAVQSPARTGKKPAQPKQESGKEAEGTGVEEPPRSGEGKAAEASSAAAAPALSPAKIRIKQSGQSEAEAGPPNDPQTQKADSNSKGMSNGDGPSSAAPAGTAKPSAGPKGAKQEGTLAAAGSSPAQPGSTPGKAASTAAANDPYTPGAGMPEAPRCASSEAAQPEPAARSGSMARPEEVSAFRMTRRKHESTAASKASGGAESATKTPVDALKASEPTAPSSSPADMSDDDDRPGQANGKPKAVEGDVGADAVPPSQNIMAARLEANDAEAAKAVWTSTPVHREPISTEKP